jgi:hypothetical protein
VVGIHKKKIHQVILCTLFMMLAATASAAVTARVDRPTVDLNESFTLEIIADSNTDLEPDLLPLGESFFVGQVSKLSNTSIFNGEIRRSLTWTVALMPKTTGVQEIPPITIGTEQSEPVRITVNEPSNAPPGEADVFVTSEVDLKETYVQAQILYRIRIYRAVATRQPALREPTISGVEALVELAGDERQYEAVLNGRAYNVIERVIALYPQESGEIQISPARFEARVLRDGRITGRKVFQSDPHTINVLPIPAPPASHPDAMWLPARDVQLSEDWSRSPDEMEVGEPVTRNVSLSALGQIETQLPAIGAPEVDGLNIYADKPELSRTLESGGIRGIRKDQYAIIGLASGELQLPAVEVPWWDIEASEWKIATLPTRVLTVRGDTVARVPVAPPVELPAEDSTGVTPPAEPVPVVVADSFWQRAAELLAVLWILTVAAWWWSSRSQPRRSLEPREPELPPVHKRQAQLLKTARKAAVAGDGTGVRAAILEWGGLQWPDDTPRSIGELSSRVASPLADELRRLSSASYGPASGEWDGGNLAKALKSVSILTPDEERIASEQLPPLMPPAA